MIFVYLGIFVALAWQDWKVKSISNDFLLLLWGLAVIDAIRLWQGNESGWQMIGRILLGIATSRLVIRFGKDKLWGRGDSLVVIWLFTALPFADSLKIVFYGMVMLWFGALYCKILKRKTECLPLLPFLTGGFILAIIF